MSQHDDANVAEEELLFRNGHENDLHTSADCAEKGSRKLVSRMILLSKKLAAEDALGLEELGQAQHPEGADLPDGGEEGDAEDTGNVDESLVDEEIAPLEDGFEPPSEPPPGFGPLDDPPPMMEDIVGDFWADDSLPLEEVDANVSEMDAGFPTESIALPVTEAFVMSPTPSPTVDVAVDSATTVEEELRLVYLGLLKRAADQRKGLWDTCAEIRDLEVQLGLDDDLTDSAGIDLRNVKSFQVVMERAGFGSKVRERTGTLPSELLRPEKRTRDEIHAANPRGASCKKAAQRSRLQVVHTSVVQELSATAAEDIEI